MKVSVEEFFQDFYDRQVFHSIIADQYVKWAYIDAAYNSIVEKDESFSSVDRDIFRKEMIAVRMEMVGLAFTHSIRDREKLLNQSIFTKNYLDKNDQSELWDISGEYNRAIALSVDVDKNEKTLAEIKKRRMLLFEECMEKFKKYDIDGTCVERICNREGSSDAWEKQYTLSGLTLRFTARVGFGEGVNPDAIIGITSVIYGFYQGAKETIKSVQFE